MNDSNGLVVETKTPPNFSTTGLSFSRAEIESLDINNCQELEEIKLIQSVIKRSPGSCHVENYTK